ncbi:hypothetical protein EJ05DRAFT_542273 [Pseudovirgaria hyperparasitica]|uniref:Uncharacterized protein n=1 Tax=Pseudovirgaria hyperparasitica TaxID=470096 RepID=A0A6A6VUM4_9PEZI|nr:uncharacterized protein EJ05DRAFT_542273 [Pseudovirgaria hyperparasitica]KAF2752957.1 hypothetical protein EJ05DRAFT_542273 [Pseudovirgaria hyperparasitica]
MPKGSPTHLPYIHNGYHSTNPDQGSTDDFFDDHLPPPPIVKRRRTIRRPDSWEKKCAYKTGMDVEDMHKKSGAPSSATLEREVMANTEDDRSEGETSQQPSLTFKRMATLLSSLRFVARLKLVQNDRWPTKWTILVTLALYTLLLSAVFETAFALLPHMCLWLGPEWSWCAWYEISDLSRHLLLILTWPACWVTGGYSSAAYYIGHADREPWYPFTPQALFPGRALFDAQAALHNVSCYIPFESRPEDLVQDCIDKYQDLYRRPDLELQIGRIDHVMRLPDCRNGHLMIVLSALEMLAPLRDSWNETGACAREASRRITTSQQDFGISNNREDLDVEVKHFLSRLLQRPYSVATIIQEVWRLQNVLRQQRPCSGANIGQLVHLTDRLLVQESIDFGRAHKIIDTYLSSLREQREMLSQNPNASGACDSTIVNNLIAHRNQFLHDLTSLERINLHIGLYDTDTDSARATVSSPSAAKHEPRVGDHALKNDRTPLLRTITPMLDHGTSLNQKPHTSTVPRERSNEDKLRSDIIPLSKQSAFHSDDCNQVYNQLQDSSILRSQTALSANDLPEPPSTPFSMANTEQQGLKDFGAPATRYPSQSRATNTLDDLLCVDEDAPGIELKTADTSREYTVDSHCFIKWAGMKLAMIICIFGLCFVLLLLKRKQGAERDGQDDGDMNEETLLERNESRPGQMARAELEVLLAQSSRMARSSLEVVSPTEPQDKEQTSHEKSVKRRLGHNTQKIPAYSDTVRDAGQGKEKRTHEESMDSPPFQNHETPPSGYLAKARVWFSKRAAMRQMNAHLSENQSAASVSTTTPDIPPTSTEAPIETRDLELIEDQNVATDTSLIQMSPITKDAEDQSRISQNSTSVSTRPSPPAIASSKTSTDTLRPCKSPSPDSLSITAEANGAKNKLPISLASPDIQLAFNELQEPNSPPRPWASSRSKYSSPALTQTTPEPVLPSRSSLPHPPSTPSTNPDPDDWDIVPEHLPSLSDRSTASGALQGRDMYPQLRVIAQKSTPKVADASLSTHETVEGLQSISIVLKEGEQDKIITEDCLDTVAVDDDVQDQIGICRVVSGTASGDKLSMATSNIAQKEPKFDPVGEPSTKTRNKIVSRSYTPKPYSPASQYSSRFLTDDKTSPTIDVFDEAIRSTTLEPTVISDPSPDSPDCRFSSPKQLVHEHSPTANILAELKYSLPESTGISTTPTPRSTISRISSPTQPDNAPASPIALVLNDAVQSTFLEHHQLDDTSSSTSFTTPLNEPQQGLYKPKPGLVASMGNAPSLSTLRPSLLPTPFLPPIQIANRPNPAREVPAYVQPPVQELSEIEEASSSAGTATRESQQQVPDTATPTTSHPQPSSHPRIDDPPNRDPDTPDSVLSNVVEHHQPENASNSTKAGWKKSHCTRHSLPPIHTPNEQDSQDIPSQHTPTAASFPRSVQDPTISEHKGHSSADVPACPQVTCSFVHDHEQHEGGADSITDKNPYASIPDGKRLYMAEDGYSQCRRRCRGETEGSENMDLDNDQKGARQLQSMQGLEIDDAKQYDHTGHSSTAAAAAGQEQVRPSNSPPFSPSKKPHWRGDHLVGYQGNMAGRPRWRYPGPSP